MNLRARASVFAHVFAETLLHPLSDSTIVIKDNKVIRVDRIRRNGDLRKVSNASPPRNSSGG